MIKAFLLIFEPMQAWERVFRAQRSVGFILFLYLLPMVILSSLAEGYGLVTWGRWQEDLDHLRPFTRGQAVVYEVAQALLSLGVVFIAARILRSLGETFHGRHTFTQGFTTIAYGLSPMFLLRMLDVFPSISPWTTWTIGICLSVAVFYQGVPRIMMPDAPHAFGLFLMNSVLVVLITGLARFVTAWYLSGHFKPVEHMISELAKRLPF
ncbi:MAG: DUF1282 domain-containing protein [Pedosphaera sp.]|nr:DUF1282 domain-containing protein [Pedosphaera sp.]